MDRRGFLISSPINEAASQPANAKISTDQKRTSLSLKLGTRAEGAKEVAGPKRCQATRPMIMRIATGTHIASAPRLWSHLPTSRPMMFRIATTASVTKENAM